MYKVKFADIGEGLTEGTVTEVLVKVGDNVKSGDPLFNVETDKVSSDIYAPVDGVIAKIAIEQGQEIKVGDIVIEIEDGEGGSVEPNKEIQKEKPVEENASVVGSTPVSDELITRNQSATKAQQIVDFSNQSSLIDNSNANVKASPLAKKMAAVMGVDLTKVTPTGPNNRILAADIELFASSPKIEPEGPKTVTHMSPLPQVPTPLGIDPMNRTQLPKQGSFEQKVDYANPLISVPEFNDPLLFDSIPMNPIRKATVKAMDVAHTKVAGFTGFRNIDITDLVNLRNKLKGYADTQRVKLTYLAFIIKAVTLSLRDMPNLNVRIDEENKAIKYANQINIGMACDTPDGLMVPVIKNADRLSVLQIAVKINDLAIKARSKKLSMNEMTGATFTVTNFGSVGLDFATPIVNHPESAILGVGTITRAPGVVKDQIVIRDFMPFSLTADHKVIDGADAGRFLQRIAFYLQNPEIILV
ncbi:pyruvate dehydrogenase E2 component (dihydrolipoamide acetyltransferase) [Spiroplasma corruscae]|uniref:Dihydrolipoamide acetyltransferase component of pyruvate dehydrogenase complex n=1 Tax=Spiroplasma corruscae TaxID=216934 RepID=A0A222ENY8_9MOLU|nr:dihydrolipoamide acetyltransferase family protein [Spiroplasma corruscae]ASP28207.1 pyruvate dehydrogenase E2 component (dihydrolipoamide acetyltransferase) [Spiroplasma corruscae]